MKVGTDGVLLGAWVQVPSEGAILDIGAGSGLLSLMVAQRGTGPIDAVELDPVAAQRATENARNSPWSSRINVISCDIMQFTSPAFYHLILSNPPFFHRALKAPDARRSLARHTHTLTPESLIEKALEWLHRDGHFCLILPSETAETFLKEAMSKGLFLHRRCTVITKAGKPPKRTLLDLTRKPTPTEETRLILQGTHPNQRSETYRELTRNYYLDSKEL